ncbi:MAG: hypothetical protein HQL45_07205 [Alphaproteobacteria bacterium]|nr:hypothetical protein [Alphaproteobacteria bacterium]
MSDNLSTDSKNVATSDPRGIGELLKDVDCALNFACRSGLATAEILEAAKKLDLATNEAERFALARPLLNDLAGKIKPATIEGARQLFEPAKAWFFPKIFGWIRRFEFVLYGLGFFLVLLYFQIVAASASFAVAAYEKAQTEYVAVLSEITRLKLTQGDNFDITKHDDLIRKKEIVMGRMVSASDTIRVVERYVPSWLSQKPEGCVEKKPCVQNPEGGAQKPEDGAKKPDGGAQKSATANQTEIIAQARLQHYLEIIGKYLLPVLYGLMGACTFVIRRMMAQQDEASFQRSTMNKYRFRLLLGMVLGGIFSLFFSPEIMNGLNLSLSAMSFLLGYGVEVFFSRLDDWVEKLRAASVSGKPKDEEASVEAKDGKGGGADKLTAGG